MKKLFISFMALLCTLGAFAQSTAENINQPKAMKPIIEVAVKNAPIAQWPGKMPMRVSGIGVMITSGTAKFLNQATTST